MVKPISVSALLFILIVTGGVQAQSQLNFTRNVTLPGRDSFVAANSTHFFSVLYSYVSYGIEQLQINVNSTGGLDVNTCNLTVHLKPDGNMVAFDILKQLKGQVLGSGRHIITWILHENELRPLLIDVQQCSYKSIRLPTTPNTIFRSRFPWIVPYENSFDLFFVSNDVPEKCWPCRFNNKGEQIQLEHGMKNATSDPGFLLQTVNLSAQSNGYFYLQNFFDFPKEWATLQLIDNNFKVLQEKVIDHNVDTISINYNKGSLIFGLCKAYAKIWHAIACEQFDANFNLTFFTRMPLLQNQTGNVMSVKLDSHGNSHLGFEMQEDTAISTKYYRYYQYIRLDATGKIIKSLNFGEIGEDLFASDLQSLIVDNQYCIGSTEMTLTGIGKRKVVKCIDIENE